MITLKKLIKVVKFCLMIFSALWLRTTKQQPLCLCWQVSIKAAACLRKKSGVVYQTFKTFNGCMLHTIKYYYLFLQKLRNLKYRLKIQNELLRKLLLTSFKTTLHLHFSGIIHTCIQQGVRLCLRQSYTIHVREN